MTLDSTLPAFSRFPSACAAARRVGLGLLVAGMAFAAVFGAPSQALAQQDMRGLLDRLDRMERDLTILQRQVYRGTTQGAPAPDRSPGGTRDVTAAPLIGEGGDMPQEAAARLASRLNQFERVMAELTGQVEQAAWKADQVERKLERTLNDVEFRLARIERHLGVAPDLAAGGERPDETAMLRPLGEAERPLLREPGSGLPGGVEQQAVAPRGPSPLVPMDPQTRPDEERPGTERPGAVLPEGTPQEQYNFAFNLLRQTEFAAAERAMRAFVEAHPDHQLAGNAQYWLGETYYVRGDYEQAAVEFLEGYRRYGEGAKAPDNLLKLGLSLANIGKVQEACAALGRLEREYADAPDSIKRRTEQERRRLECA